MTRRISDDLKIYTSYVRVAEAHLALAEESSSKNRSYYNSISDKMQKWMYNILNSFETQMLREGKFQYISLVEVLRKRVENKFREIDSLEGAVE